jgi:hypothetical protein
LNINQEEKKKMKNKTLAVLMTASMIMSAVIPAAPVFAADKTEKTEITTSASTADTAKVIGDWTCGASGTKTLTINEDGTYSMSTPDKDEEGKWKISNDYLTLDNGKEDAVKCTFDGATISVYSGDNISVFQKNAVSKTDTKTSDVKSDTESSIENTEEKVTPTKDDIIGDWYASLLGMTAKFTFNEDGTAEMDMDALDSLAEQTDATVESNNVTWKINGDDVVMTSEDGTEEESEDTVFAFYGDKMTANYDGVEMTLVRNADDVMAEEGVVKDDATEEDFKGVWKTDKISLLEMSMSPEDVGMDTSFVDIKDKTADITFITSDKKTYEVNDIETTFEDASIKMDVSCEQLGDYLDELASVDVNVDDIETADGVTATWTDDETDTAKNETDSLAENSDADNASTDIAKEDANETDDDSTASLDSFGSKNDGISHATFQMLEDGRMKCNLQANLKTNDSSMSMDYVIYLTKSSEEDIENAKNEESGTTKEVTSTENTDMNTSDNNSSDDASDTTTTTNTTNATSKPSAVANAKPGDTFEEDGIVYKMADEEPEYDEEADDDDNYTPERTASDDNMEAVANLNEKIEQEAATSKK